MVTYGCYIWLFFLQPQGVGRTPHMKGVRMLIGNFELNPLKRYLEIPRIDFRETLHNRGHLSKEYVAKSISKGNAEKGWNLL